MDIKNTKEVNKIRHTTFPNKKDRKVNVAGWVTPQVKHSFNVIARENYHVSASTLIRILAERLIKRDVSINRGVSTSDLDREVIDGINADYRPSPLEEDIALLFPSEEDTAINEASDKGEEESARILFEELKYPSASTFLYEIASSKGMAQTGNIIEMIMSKDTGKVFSAAIYKSEDYFNSKVPVNTMYFDSDGNKLTSIAGKHDTLYLDEGTETLLREIYIINHPSLGHFTALLMKTTEEYCLDLMTGTNAINLLRT